MRGDKVAATTRDVASLDGLVEHYSEHILPLTLDVTSEQQVLDAVALAHRHFGRLDVVLNNAGYALVGATEAAKLGEVKAEVRDQLLRCAARHPGGAADPAPAERGAHPWSLKRGRHRGRAHPAYPLVLGKWRLVSTSPLEMFMCFEY